MRSIFWKTAVAMAVAMVGLAVMGAQCGGGGGGGVTSRTFAPGSLIIPMDNCYQKRDTATTPSQSVGCNATADDGVFRAYGMVYFLLRNGVTVYWAINPQKTTFTAIDVTIPAPGSGPVVKKYDWTAKAVASFSFPGATPIQYLGGPFIIDSSEANTVLGLLASSPDFAQMRAEATRTTSPVTVEIHEAESSFDVAQVRILKGTPPRIAILNIGNAAVGVMHDYLVDAGLDDPSCTDPNCGGGITATGGCSNLGFPVNSSKPGKIYDILCDKDFVSTGGSVKLLETANGKLAYPLLWAPHWSGGTMTTTLEAQLKNIASFVDQGGNLFAECHSIATLEGGIKLGGKPAEPGISETRFQSTQGMRFNGSGTTSFQSSAYTHPYTQIGDFAFTPLGGSITTFYPDDHSVDGAPYSSYKTGIQRFITENSNGVPWDLYTSIRKDGDETKGNVVYLGGHTYAAQTAGARLILNTLFNLGFGGCVDPGTACNTGKLGVCAQGVLRCSSDGYACTPLNQPASEICDGLDNDCNGEVDEGSVCSSGECKDGDQQPCYSGPDGTRGVGTCTGGLKTCAGGAWGACVGEVLPVEEACNGKDDDCDGPPDEGTLCSDREVCTNGVCVSATCGVEERCGTGYECSAGSGGSCQPITCIDAEPCSPGQVCDQGACTDPCANVRCGAGTTCTSGSCFGGSCYRGTCSSGQLCIKGQCASDPCAGVSCAQGTFCRAGYCVRSCAYVECPYGQTCSADGFCVADKACSPACDSGQVCSNGACIADPCAGVSCDFGQVCSSGSCVDDPCRLTTCPSDTKCSAGQCQSSHPYQPPPGNGSSGGSSGGCGQGSTGRPEPLGLLLVAIALVPRLRRRVQQLSGRRSVLLPVMVAVMTVGLGCSSKGNQSCSAVQTSCGGSCVDLSADRGNCGTCGHVCGQSSTCARGACLLQTGNPYLAAIDPTASGPSSSVQIHFTGENFQAGATALFESGPLAGERALDVQSATAATLATPLDLSSVAIGSTGVRVVNPGKLISNPATFEITATFGISSVTPAGARQDQSVSLVLAGHGFSSGLTVTFTPTAGGSSKSYTATVKSSKEAEVTIDFTTMSVGVYDVTAANGGAASNTAKFSVTQGVPVLDSISPTSAQGGSGSITGTLTGTYFYPSSQVHASIGGVDSPLPTIYYDSVTPPVLKVTMDLAQVPAGTYAITVVNPGYPAPLVSASKSFTVN